MCDINESYFEHYVLIRTNNPKHIYHLDVLRTILQTENVFNLQKHSTESTENVLPESEINLRNFKLMNYFVHV